MKREIYFAAVIGFVILLAIYVFFLGNPTYEPKMMEEHIRGNHNAPVVIVEFSDFQCPYCGAVQPTLKQLLAEYPDDVKLIYRHFPLPSHSYALKAAEASECAAEEGKFWEYHDLLFANQNRLDIASLKDYATQLRLDETSFAACLGSGVMAQRVEFAKQSGVEKGVTGTPTFFINSRMLSGNQQYDVFKSAVEEELKK